MMVDTELQIPAIEWSSFLNDHFRWYQGEHVGLIGPTGQGKTTLSLNLLPLRRFVVVFATKPRDTVIRNLRKARGYKTIRQWRSMEPTLYPRRILWPDASRLDSDDTQRQVFSDALESIYREGGWTVYFDETWYMVHQLGMDRVIKKYLLQARSLDISLIAAAQRPAWIPVEVFDQSTHLFFFRDNDYRNLQKIGGIGFLDRDVIQYHVARLGQYETLYINTRNGEMIRTRAPGPKGGKK